ncbi:hypothetical protein AQ853_20990 [Burkholderia pseudomallei]|uniref:hypothetical protein n=1 Tax=Burkholderia pseudomallei TaxID=28450 RepID=UPI0007BF7CCA|nr:hypothetical protein [Burkholderia pseudomallei]OAB17460.1 hypothetical protein AQ853_20990 [Burkholderia pseudomallei]
MHERIEFAQFEQLSLQHAAGKVNSMLVTEEQEHLQRAQYLLNGSARPIARPEFAEGEDRRVEQRHASADIYQQRETLT